MSQDCVLTPVRFSFFPDMFLLSVVGAYSVSLMVMVCLILGIEDIVPHIFLYLALTRLHRDSQLN